MGRASGSRVAMIHRESVARRSTRSDTRSAIAGSPAATCRSSSTIAPRYFFRRTSSHAAISELGESFFDARSYTSFRLLRAFGARGSIADMNPRRKPKSVLCSLRSENRMNSSWALSRYCRRATVLPYPAGAMTSVTGYAAARAKRSISLVLVTGSNGFTSSARPTATRPRIK